MLDLRHTDIQYLHGVGPKRAELLRKELGVSTYYDLLYYFPYRYIDRSVMNHVNELNGDEAAVQLKGRFLTFNTVGEGRKRRLQALFTDGTGTIEVVWFNRVASIQKTYNTNTQYILFGKPSLFNNHLNIVHPEVDVVTTEHVAQGLTGVYSLTEVLRNRSFTSRAIHKLILTLLETPAVQYISETLPPDLLHRFRLMPLAEALTGVHGEHLVITEVRVHELLILAECLVVECARGQTQLVGLVLQGLNDAGMAVALVNG